MAKSNPEIRCEAEKVLGSIRELRLQAERVLSDWQRENGWCKEHQLLLKERLASVEEQLSLVSDALHDIAEEKCEEKLFVFTVDAGIPLQATGTIRADCYREAVDEFWDQVERDGLVYRDEFSDKKFRMTDWHIEIPSQDSVQIDEIESDNIGPGDRDNTFRVRR